MRLTKEHVKVPYSLKDYCLHLRVDGHVIEGNHVIRAQGQHAKAICLEVIQYPHTAGDAA